MASLRVDVPNQIAVFNNSSVKVEEFNGEEEARCVVEIRSATRTHSVSCRNCENQKRRRSVYARIRDGLLSGINIEAKLKRYHVKSHRTSSPFNFLRKLLGILFQDDADSKFTDEELGTLSTSQLKELRKSLQNLLSDKERELGLERTICGEERQILEKTKRKARELEAMAWVTLKPFINRHPSLDDLTRVLMF